VPQDNITEAVHGKLHQAHARLPMTATWNISIVRVCLSPSLHAHLSVRVLSFIDHAVSSNRADHSLVTLYRSAACTTSAPSVITRRVLLRDRCPVCLSLCPVLSVTLVYCSQTVGRIKIKLGIQVGLGPGHIVLDGDPAPPTKTGHNGWMD